MTAGGSSDGYWNATPREIVAVLDARSERDAETWRQGVTLAWANAGLTRAQEMPALETLLPGDIAHGPTEASDIRDQHNLKLWQMVIEQQFGGDEETVQ